MYGQPGFYPSPTTQVAQQRLQSMEAQYPQYASPSPMGYPQSPMFQPPQQAPAAPMIKGRPVSNEEEANAAMIDFDGSLFIFPDKAHGKIYTKQLGLDGNIVFLKYALEQPSANPLPQPVPSEAPSEYVKQPDLVKELKAVYERLETLERRLPAQPENQGKGGHK